MVRIQKVTSTAFKVKIHAANESQLISLVKTFMTEFEDGCKISTSDETFEREKLVLDLKDSLMEEVSHLKTLEGSFEFVEGQSAREAKSDTAFTRLSAIVSSKTTVNDVKA